MFCIGAVTFAELEKLKARGWEAEAPTAQMVIDRGFGFDGYPDIKAGLPYNPESDCYYVQFYVDSDLFSVMTGPDWAPEG
jgi:hypothetical protein